ncbi:MAG: DUF4405 domain-containing protein [Chloroflexi bacterium]|nr:DUF4405 domain-containing protein [Chloroflexota bacterium]
MKTNLLVDLSIFAAFLVAFEPKFTGVPIHEWLSLALAGALVTHLVLHWRWIVSVTTRFWHQLIHSSRLNYAVDSLAFLAFTAMLFSGIMISKSILPFLGIAGSHDVFWRWLHKTSADASLMLMALHFALHWKWTSTTLTRLVLAPVRVRLTRR